MTKQTEISNKSKLNQVTIDGEFFFKIDNINSLRPFFMSVVSDSDHWMFISSNGGLSAGRKNAEHALFPYYTDDKITNSAESTGSKTIIKVYKEGDVHIWEPFSIRQFKTYSTKRNLYKSKYGNKIIFEEVNEDLGISFKYAWYNGDIFGFVRKSYLINNSNNKLKVEFIDGIQNVLPSGVPSDLQNNASNLVNAYKRSELHTESGLGIFALSAIIVDKAEPSEALKANVVWSLGVDKPTYLLSSLQLNNFRNNISIVPEEDVKGEEGAYFINSTLEIDANAERTWSIVANVNQDHNDIAALIDQIRNDNTLEEKVYNDVEQGTFNLIKLNAASDGLQVSNDSLKDSRHFANVLFNNMRGGVFDDNYSIDKKDFISYLKNANRQVFNENKGVITDLPESLDSYKLRAFFKSSEDASLKRLTIEYLPLRFSRRHGDPSRPWNKFSINTKNEHDGSKVLDYEGNWRDIFQNWEALVHSYPDFIEGMIFRFLNASTFDGYNPYRITKDGFDWEVIEPDDPWSYIGYWGDHQIIYLLKFLEFIHKHQPSKLSKYFNEEVFVYANVPYKIKPYSEIVKDPKETIDFDEDTDKNIRLKVNNIGADGALIQDEKSNIHQVNLIEKILATVLSKVSNYIPEGGIWMNTQRPEWNDANNALVGNGISMVTLYYLRRFLNFFSSALDNIDLKEVKVSSELNDFYKAIRKTFEDHNHLLSQQINDVDRKTFVDQLGTAASEYRVHIYEKSFWGAKRSISIEGIKRFFKDVLSHIDHSIKSNKRDDNLYHAYNLLTISDHKMEVGYLNEMLEGQVAVLSSGYLSPTESLSVLDALKKSALFRDDQYSYILYPNKNLPGFLEKNNIPEPDIKKSKLLSKLLEDNDQTIIKKDVFGKYHFHGNFRNANELIKALNSLDQKLYGELVKEEKALIAQVYESVFNHKSFTGRSGTFYGYEGLGSIYWHMVSKLLLAVQETSVDAVEKNDSPEIVGRILEHYYEIYEGIGVHKSPALYGAFPTDPYSHTPGNKGAQQPGMTGQVKEDILCRFGELGVTVEKGCLIFAPDLLRKTEFLENDKTYNYIDIHGNHKSLELSKGSLGFTYCQVPIVYTLSDEDKVIVNWSQKEDQFSEMTKLSKEVSLEIFERTGAVDHMLVHVDQKRLK